MTVDFFKYLSRNSDHKFAQKIWWPTYFRNRKKYNFVNKYGQSLILSLIRLQSPKNVWCGSFLAVNHQNHKNWVKSIQMHNLWLWSGWSRLKKGHFPVPPILNIYFKKSKVTKVSFLGLCSKMQIIPIKNLNIKKVVPQFLWFFRLKCWFKGQIISRI